ncbi:MAG TPA: tetratricopeptide repeat protein [Kofleriaceae bacterium]|nr:tetratricopeptide repeat protein [Kofleriaceae bacterium]
MVLPARDREALEQAVGRGSELLRQGKLDQAQRAFRAALEIDPDSARVLALLGLAHFRANEFADARTVYEQLVERAPTDASHRLNLGLVYLKLNDADRAISALEASRALDPSQGRAVSYLGLAYARGGRYAEAYRAFLIAGQNELAIEIETNLTQAERDRIHNQLGRTPQGHLTGATPYAGPSGPAARISAATMARTPTPTGIPRTPTPTAHSAAGPGTSAASGEMPSATAAEPGGSGQSATSPDATGLGATIPIATILSATGPDATGLGATIPIATIPIATSLGATIPIATIPSAISAGATSPGTVTDGGVATSPGAATSATSTIAERSPAPPGIRRTPPPGSIAPDYTPRASAPSISPDSTPRASAPSIAPDSTPRASAPSIAPESDLNATVPIRTFESMTRTPTPVGVPRTKPPSAPPGKRRSQELAAAAAPAGVAAPGDAAGVATVHDVHGKIHIDAATATGAVPPYTVQLSASPDGARASDSMQFVLPRGEPAAPQESLDGSSMISRAVASASPAPVGLRTRTGGYSPRPLAELATDQLIRPDEGEDVLEVAAGGALIIRVADRVLTRLDGVSITGGDLSFELATRRSRGHATEEAFDYGGAQLHAVSGRGYLIAVPGEHTFTAVSLDDDILYLREDLVFAFQSQLRWENGNVPGLRGRLPVVQFRGNGALAMRLARPLVRVKLPAQGMLFIDADRLAGWIGRVIPRAVVPPPGGPLGAMCVECTGEGVVLVESAPRDSAAELPRVTAKWPRVTIEPFPTGPLPTPPTAPGALGADALAGAPAETTASPDDTVPTPAEPSEPDPHADRDRLDDLGF